MADRFELKKEKHLCVILGSWCHLLVLQSIYIASTGNVVTVFWNRRFLEIRPVRFGGAPRGRFGRASVWKEPTRCNRTPGLEPTSLYSQFGSRYLRTSDGRCRRFSYVRNQRMVKRGQRTSENGWSWTLWDCTGPGSYKTNTL